MPAKPNKPVRPRWLRPVLSSLALLAFEFAAADGFPWLDTLDAGDEVMASGTRLMELPLGLHRLDRDAAETDATVNIAVHGWNSRGYEWVHLVKSLDGPASSIWFLRWNWDECPGAAAQALNRQLSEAPFAHAEGIRLIGHSYGGVLVATAAEQWQGAVPLEAHTIAAPLAGVGDRCPYKTPAALPGNVAFHEWRTRHQLDGAFRAMPVDPQVAELPGSRVTLLPATYNGRRLGHNWSVSWVADTLAGVAPAP